MSRLNTQVNVSGRALFVGRFQPFHNGHLAVINQLLERHNEVIIAIGSAEESISSDNPMTAGERVEMIRRCFPTSTLSRLIIVPVRDINNNNIWVAHLVSHLPEFGVVYSNNPLVHYLFSRSGIRTEKFEFYERKSCEGTKIRKDILTGGNEWKKCVPKEVAAYLERLEIRKRLAISL
ncbi:MAG: nicotinamide-nucleotide adenylyltransferase [Candidatus Micrarchaeota archaeon]